MTSEVGSLSRGALTLLLNLMRSPSMESTAEYLNASGVFNELMAAKLLYYTGVDVTNIYIDDQVHELLPNPDGPGYRYFSVAVGWVEVPAQSVRRFRLDHQRLLVRIQGWLGISEHQSIVSLQADAIWDLGDIWIGKRRLAVLFMRRAQLAESAANLRNTLLSFSRRRSAIVLTDSTINKYGPSLPGNPLCIAIEHLLRPEQQQISTLEKDMISEMLGSGSAQADPRAPLSCSEDGGMLRINGEDYFFTGLTQKRIVRQLFEAWEAGQSRLRTAVVLQEAESKTKAISQAFSGSKRDWKKVIGYRDGYCWLIVE